jgi:hypothetical protein
MTVSFDTLSFAKRLTEAGEKPAVAEAHAMALKEFVMETVATKADIRELRDEIHDLRDEVQEARQEFVFFRKDVNARFALKEEPRNESLLRKDFDALVSKLTVRMGGMLVVAVGVVATRSSDLPDML